MKHIKKFENSFFDDNNIKDLTNHQLVENFKEAVMDYNYNPTSTPYNESGFSLDELESEILRRMGSDDDDDDESWDDEN